MSLLSHPSLDLYPRIQPQRASAALQLIQLPYPCSRSLSNLAPRAPASSWCALGAPRCGGLRDHTNKVLIVIQNCHSRSLSALSHISREPPPESLSTYYIRKKFFTGPRWS